MSQLDRIRLKNMITWAIQGYAQSEMTALSCHDFNHRESAYDAMEKLSKDAEEISSYAMSGIFSKESDEHSYTISVEDDQ